MPRPVLSSLTFLASVAVMSGCGKVPPLPQPPMNSRVVVAPVRSATLEDSLRLSGSLEARDQVTLKTEIEGELLEIAAEEGSLVTKGQVLFRFDESKLRPRLASAESDLAVALSDLERLNSAKASNPTLVSKSEFDKTSGAVRAAEAAVNLIKAELTDAVVTAPFEGVVGRKLVSRGQWLNRGQELATLTRLDPLDVSFGVPETKVPKLALGQEVSLTFPGDATPIKGKLRFIAAQVDAGTRTLLVKAEVANPKGALRPGLFATVDLSFTAAKPSLLVDQAAVMFKGGKPLVYRINKENKAEFVPVTIGRQLPTETEVTSGLAEGELVVIEGTQKVFFPGMPVDISVKSRSHGVPDARTLEPNAPLLPPMTPPDAKPEPKK